MKTLDRLLEDSAMLDRRQFLNRIGLGTSLLLTPSFLEELDARQPSRGRRHVVILGAGMAGLCAAYELEQRGHAIVVLEADPSQLQYEAATKVLAVTERRFWETDDGIYGGSTFTDLPSQATVYPSDNSEARDPTVSNRPGVLLASFTWGNAARTVDRLPAARRADFQMSQAAKIHPQLREPRLVRHAVAWSWDDHPWARGGFAFPAPAQRSLVRDAAAPEGLIYFAGEHCSLHHGWIQGALETALMAVREMLAKKV